MPHTHSENRTAYAYARATTHIDTLLYEIPKTQLRVLYILSRIGEAPGPDIARASEGKITIKSIPKLLARLEKYDQANDLICKRNTVPDGVSSTPGVLYAVSDLVMVRADLIEELLKTQKQDTIGYGNY